MITEAALDNAHWCDAMCRAHGRPGAFGPRAWTNPVRTPLYYPDAVTLTEDASVRDVLDGIDRSAPGASVKDSFARLDLAPEGFQLLFEARWIHRPAGTAARSPRGARWRAVRTAADLAAWASAWSGGDADEAALFRAELLADPTTTIVAGYESHEDEADEGRIVGGAVLSERAGGRVTGVSNLFAADGTDPAEAWAGCLSLADTTRPVVGYESGDDLLPARALGFEETGPLRVWLDTGA
ncbi:MULTISPECIES: hypothetical protein [Streptomyces]|uniref:hypothetical protein n=1 Tax=Streptomyces TaxID=1883 RepID=UPI00131838FC|nr:MULTISPECIES: hypothetical protein [Streptomyces]QGZ48814.1 hypothetical protein GPZ77_10865 [Streptomyces sp. QHH-9511]GGU16694.1 hypothetical protein GCM10010272_71330 [Streptomyces lateritius]